MEAKDVWRALSSEQKDRVAEKLKSTKNYLSQVIHGHCPAGALLAKHLERELDRHRKRMENENETQSR